MCVCVSVCVLNCVCVCPCVCERERERRGGGGSCRYVHVSQTLLLTFFMSHSLPFSPILPSPPPPPPSLPLPLHFILCPSVPSIPHFLLSLNVRQIIANALSQSLSDCFHKGSSLRQQCLPDRGRKNNISHIDFLKDNVRIDLGQVTMQEKTVEREEGLSFG